MKSPGNCGRPQQVACATAPSEKVRQAQMGEVYLTSCIHLLSLVPYATRSMFILQQRVFDDLSISKQVVYWEVELLAQDKPEPDQAKEGSTRFGWGKQPALKSFCPI